MILYGPLGITIFLAAYVLCSENEIYCSPYHYHEQTLAKIVRLEFQMEQLEKRVSYTATVTSITTPCEDNWIAFQGSCYLLGHDKQSFSDASRFCEHHRSHLIRIDNALENTFVQGLMRRLKDAKFWTGLNDLVTEGIWQWYDNDEIATYLDWNPGEPNQFTTANCAAIREDYGYNWVDDHCDYNFYALCEKTYEL